MVNQHLNGTPIHLPNNTPLQLAKRAIGKCDKHFKLWETVYFNAPLIRQIADEMWNHLNTRTDKLVTELPKLGSVS